MKFIRLMKEDWIRAVCSWGFFLSVIMVTILVTTSGYTMLPQSNSIIMLLYSGMRGNGVEVVVHSILPLIPFAMSFAFEWKERSYLFYLVRVGPERYILSKLIVSAVSGFLVMMIGVLLAIPALQLLAPELPILFENIFSDFVTPLYEKGQIALALFIYIFHYALSGCLTAVCAVWFSTYIPNPFAVLAAPMTIYFTILRFNFLSASAGILKNSPLDFLDPVYWINNTYPTTSAAVALLTKGCTVLFLCLLMGFGSVRQMQRRVLND
jgi:hypothetical protein